MNDPAAHLPKTNVDLLKVLLTGKPLALNLVAAASVSNREEALEALKRVLLTRLQEELNTLKNGKAEVD
jgi:hypothetical protein